MPLAAPHPPTSARASARRGPRAGLAAVALAIAAGPRIAAADPPPSDLPPLYGTPLPSPAPAPVPASAPAPALAPPGVPVTPPVLPGYARLPPGYAPFAWSGPPMRPIVQSETLPPLPPRRYYSPGLFAGGVVAVGVGMATVLLGSYFVASAPGRIEIYCDTPSFPCAYKTDAQRLTGGAIMMAAGTLVGVAGIPMWFIGARRVVVPDEKKAARAAPLPVDVRVGAGTASLRFRF